MVFLHGWNHALIQDLTHILYFYRVAYFSKEVQLIRSKSIFDGMVCQGFLSRFSHQDPSGPFRWTPRQWWSNPQLVCVKIGHPGTPKIQWIFIMFPHENSNFKGIPHVWIHPHHILLSVAYPRTFLETGWVHPYLLVENTMVSPQLFNSPLYTYNQL
jgi:hypothetical protein